MTSTTVNVMEAVYDEGKFEEFVLLAAELLEDDHQGGATKLNKLLYFSDFTFVRTHGRPISGADYQKLHHGPAPRRLLPVRKRLTERGDIEIEIETDPLGYRTDRISVLKKTSRSALDAVEIQTMETVASLLRSMTGAEVSALSHEDPGWQLVEPGDTIPYESAYLRPDDEVPAAMEAAVRSRARELAVEHADRAVR